MATRPTHADAPVLRGGSSHLRERSFTIEQFGELVSSALDMQRIPDSALTFSFGGNTYPPPRHSARSEDTQDARQNKAGTFMRLRGVFARKLESRNASLDVPPEMRRLASSSAPVLSHLQLQTIPTSASLISLDFDANYLDSPSDPATPADSACFPSITLPPSKSHNAPENRVYVNESPMLDVPQDVRNYSSTRSFLNLKPLTIPKLNKKSSRALFSSGPPPTPPPERSSLARTESPLANIDLCRIDSEGMRSFFDDSGYAEELRAPKIIKKKSKPSFRSFFSSNPSGSDIPPVPSGYKHDKVLPPTPVTEERPGARQRIHLPVKDTTDPRSMPLVDRGSLFYTPPTPEQKLHDKSSFSIERADPRIKVEKEPGNHRMSNWINRSANSTPRKAKRVVRSSPPSYPSPTSPLPPTPDPLPVRLPVVSPSNSDHVHVTDCIGDTSEESIDSMEIMSWRMPVLEQQISKTSTSSSVYAHALGRPSRGSIRERLGLGPRLHLHVPLPAHSRPNSNIRSISQGELLPESFDYNRNVPYLTVRPLPGTFSSSSRMPMPRLTSSSLVSLRSIATITAGSKAGCDEDEDGRRKDALDADRAFTPEDDPFAAGPLTPLTPVSPMSHTQTTKKKHRSFMPLGNDSSVSSSAPETPISAPASLPSWHYRLGANSNMSSPALTPLSPVGGTTPNPKGARASTSPSSVRSGLPPSLIEVLGVRRRTPSMPSCPPSSCRNLGQVLSRVRKVQNSQDGFSKSKLSGGSEGDGSRIVGHTESRPNSPFPLLFLRSRAAKAAPAAVKESKRSSVVSTASDGTTERAVKRPPAGQPPKRNRAALLARHAQGLEEPIASSANDIDAFGDAARNIELENARRGIVSPTAWLLDSDDYDDDSIDTNEADALTDKSAMLALDLDFNVKSSGKGGDLRAVYDEKSSEVPLSSKLCSLRRTPFPKAHCEAESETETETEGDVTLLRASQSWPLPPHRTVVVDEESGEGYHVVEPALEYVQAGSVSHTPRHSIRFPKRNSGSASVESHGSRRTDSGSPTSQKLSSFQARQIAEQLGGSVDCNNSIMDESQSSLQAPQAPALRQLKQRSRSTTSLVSASARSVKTCRTAFYSARTTISRGSEKSTFSFARSRQVGALSRDGSMHSATSSRSPPSSADHHARPSAANPESNSRSRPGSASRSAAEFNTSISPTQSNTPRREMISIPQRIVLHATAPDDAFHIVVSGWTRLLSICTKFGSVNIGASEGDDDHKLLSVSVEEVRGSKCGGDGGSRPGSKEGIAGIGISESKTCRGLSASTSKSNALIKLTLSLHQTSSPAADSRPKIAFCLPLPATLGGIVDILRQTQPAWSMS